MKALSITLKDIQLLVKDRGSLFQYFLLPLLFVLIFSGGLSSIGNSTGGAQDTRLALAVVDLDGGSAAQTLLAGIDDAGGVRTELYGQAQAQALLNEDKLARVLFIPADFSAGLSQGQPVTLRLVAHPDASTQETENVILVVQGVANHMTIDSQILASLRQMGDMQAADPAGAQAFDTERVLAQARSQFESSKQRPLIVVKQTVPARPAGSQPAPGLGQAVLSGITVLFVFLSAQTAARSIHEEKKIGSFRRLMAAPLSRPALLGGKILPHFLTALVQILVIFIVGSLGLRLIGATPVPLGNDPLGVAVISILTALCASCLGIVIAAIARTESQIGGMGMLVLWGMGLLGGCIAPVFLLDRFLGPLPKIVPQYWANRAFDNLLIRGLGMQDIVLELAVLLGFSILFFVIGVSRFEFE
jgi:ABC-2 type transport system permease protein